MLLLLFFFRQNDKTIPNLSGKTDKTSGTGQKIRENKVRGVSKMLFNTTQDSLIRIIQTLRPCCKNQYINDTNLGKPKACPIIYEIMNNKGGILNQCKGGGGAFNLVGLEQLSISLGEHLLRDLRPAACGLIQPADKLCLCCMMFCKNINELQMVLN